MQVDERRVAGGEVACDTGRRVGQDVAEILANDEAMQYEIETAMAHATIEPAHLVEIRRVMTHDRSRVVRGG